MNRDRDKFIVEAMGYKWHECQDNPDGFFCQECAEGYERVPDLDSWEGFGFLIGWLKEHTVLWTKIRWNMPMAEFMDLTADPDKAADALYKYLKEGEEWIETLW